MFHAQQVSERELCRRFQPSQSFRKIIFSPAFGTRISSQKNLSTFLRLGLSFRHPHPKRRGFSIPIPQ